MFTQFGATADTISKASTMVFRIGTDAHLYDDPDDINIIPLLDSKYDSEKCEALKRLLALIAQGFDVSNFFPQVVKNVASQSLEVKKLVYLYLLHYAEKHPSEALLSINCFQKDLGDTNPLVRAWALRTMAGIRLHVTSPLVLLAVRKCARDPSVYVRRCAANALPKLHDLRQEENASAIEEIVGILLNDNSPGIVGAAAAAFNSVCPNNLSLIGKNYTWLCETLPGVEDWGQIILIGILLRYIIARHGLVKESIMFLDGGHADKEDMRDDTSQVENSDVAGGIFLPQVAKVIARSYIEGPGKYISQSKNKNEVYSALDDASFTSAESNDDVKILLKCTSPLLWSHNSAVVLAAAGVHWIVAPKDDVTRIAKPLLFVLRSSTNSKYVVLCNIQVFAKAMPSLFAAYYEDFFISTSDSYQIKALKLEILSSIATDSSIPYIFQEFQDYIRDPDRRFAVDTIAALGLCAQRLKKVVNMCLEGLLCLTSQEYVTSNTDSVDGEAGILIQAVMSIKEIVKQDPSSYEKVILQLIRRLDLIKIPAARAIIIWMLGEYNSTGQIIPKTLTTVLKYLAYCFTSEASETKLQILNTAVKIFLYAEGEDVHAHEKVVSYMIELAKFDLNYDIRDRARLLKKLIESSLGDQNEDKNCAHVNKESEHVIAEKVLGKRNNILCPEPIDYRIYLPGSLSQIVLHAAPGYEPLPNPCSLDLTDSSQTSDGTQVSEDSYGSDDSASFSGSVDEGSAYGYSSRHSTGSRYNEGSDGSLSAGDENAGQFIQLSDAENTENTSDRQTDSTEARITQSDVSGMEEIISKKALESWLGEQPLSSDLVSSEQDHVQKSARISIGNISSRVKPKSYTLLDSASGNGLKVDYSFSSQISDIPTLLVCVEVSFQNCSAEPFSEVILADEEAGSGPESRELLTVAMERSSGSHSNVPTLVPMEEIDFLDPGQIAKRTIQVRFHHHLLPLKLTLWCNGKKHPVKLRPDIGYFVKPLPMNINTYRSREAQLPGMFEYVRRCSFTDHILQMNSNEGDNSISKDVYLVICESLALKMLSNANLFLVSVDMPVAAKLDEASGLCLRFSCEILSSSMPCLITIAIEGKCMEPLGVSVKINCEETVFGLNLLNRVVNFLVEPSSAA